MMKSQNTCQKYGIETPTAQTATARASPSFLTGNGQADTAPRAAPATAQPESSRLGQFLTCNQRQVFCVLQPYLEGGQLPYVVRKS